MKYITTLAAIVVFAMVSPQVTAQSGGFNVKNVNASNSLTVGTASESVVVLSDLVALPPLTNSEIVLLGIPAKGSLVYSSDSDVLLVFDGVWWKRVDGQNDSYILAMGSPCPGMPTVTDYDNNTYNTVLIGTQCWMAENLKVINYPNGDPINLITDSDAQWAALGDNDTDDAYCYYENNSSSDYGALYTYAAAIADNWTRDNDAVTNGPGGQGICPDGWHLPTDTEWTTLSNYLLGNSVAGGKMKEAGTSHWISPNTGATNESGFTALPGGYRSDGTGTFGLAGDSGYWWSATENFSNNASRPSLSSSSALLFPGNFNKSGGFSVRCVRD